MSAKIGERVVEKSHAQQVGIAQVVPVERRILEANEQVAQRNRQLFASKGIRVLNLISSPGSGKTTLLVETLKALDGLVRCAVIEGDQETDNDARRIADTGVPVVQINTRQGCHLDAHLVERALAQLPLQEVELLFIENVGNLICPAEFDLGEAAKVVLMSVTEGEDKPSKYPLIFHLASVVVLTKVDLLPYLRFDLELARANIRKVNPQVDIIETSCYTREGLDDWLAWLRRPAGQAR